MWIEKIANSVQRPPSWLVLSSNGTMWRSTRTPTVIATMTASIDALPRRTK